MDAVNTAGEALTALEGARASMGMSKAELARRGRLPPETVRRLLTSTKANPHFALVADLLRPLGLGLFVGKVDVPADEAPAAPELASPATSPRATARLSSTGSRVSTPPLMVMLRRSR